MTGMPLEGNNATDTSYLLPWEDSSAYHHLCDRMHAEHNPIGPTESALVARLVDIVWKRRRMRLAERAMHMHSLQSQVGYSDGGSVGRAALVMSSLSRPAGDVREALTSSEDEDEADGNYFKNELEDLNKAVAILENDLAPTAVEAAKALLRNDTLEWWEKYVEEWEIEDDPGIRAARLLKFLNFDVRREVDKFVASVEQRPALRLQAWGESLNPVRYGKLLALESELDRQFEKSLGMLIRLQEMRAEKNKNKGTADA